MRKQSNVLTQEEFPCGKAVEIVKVLVWKRIKINLWYRSLAALCS